MQSTSRRRPAGASAARPAATEVGEPRQVRKEAAAAAHLRVPAVHLAAGAPAAEASRTGASLPASAPGHPWPSGHPAGRSRVAKRL